MSKIIFIEGAKGVGKTYLLSNSSSARQQQKYKFPFPDYVKMRMESEGEKFEKINKSTESLHATIGCEMTMLTMLEQGLFNKPVIIDRGPISNAVFGIMNHRIQLDEARMHIERLSDLVLTLSGSKLLSDRVHFINITSDESRSKEDEWTFMTDQQGHGMQQDLYKEFMTVIEDRSDARTYHFHNDMGPKSVRMFDSMINDIVNL